MRSEKLSPFGRKIRYWRKLRSMSQLALACEAGVSQRHLSFVETGRSRPGSRLVVRLAEALGVPPRERNDLLQAAGLTSLYLERELSAERLAPYSRIVERMLASHEPYPAMVLDRWWNVVATNRTVRRLHPPLARAGANAIEVFLANEPPRIVNWNAVARNLLRRIHVDWLRTGQDARLGELMSQLEQRLQSAPALEDEVAVETPMIATRFDLGGQRISTVGAIVRFDTAYDVTLDELRIEMHFPADAAAEALFRSIPDDSEEQ